MSLLPNPLQTTNPPQPEGWLYKDPRIFSGAPQGYFSDEQILVEVNEGRLGEQATVWHAKRTRGDWVAAAKFKIFAERFSSGFQFLFDRAAEREMRLEGDLFAAQQLLRQKEEEKKHAEETAKDAAKPTKKSLDAQIPPEFMPLALRIDALLEDAKAIRESGQRDSRVAHGNGALFCFAAFILFGGVASFFSGFRYDHPLFGNPMPEWLGSGAFLFFCAWLYKSVRAFTG